MNSYAPRELVNNPDFGFATTDLAKVREANKTVENPRTWITARSFVGKDAVRVNIQGELISDGIVYSEHPEFGNKYQIGVRFHNPEDGPALNQIVEKFANTEVNDDPDVIYKTHFPIKDSSDGDVIFIKLQTSRDDKTFACQTVPANVTPGAGNPDIYRYMPVSIDAIVTGYWNLRENSRGIFLNVVKVTFGKEEPVKDTKRGASRTTGRQYQRS